MRVLTGLRVFTPPGGSSRGRTYEGNDFASVPAVNRKILAVERVDHHIARFFGHQSGVSDVFSWHTVPGNRCAWQDA